MSSFSSRLIVSSVRWLVVPRPEVAQVNFFGCAFASAANSARVRAGIAGFTTTASGT